MSTFKNKFTARTLCAFFALLMTVSLAFIPYYGYAAPSGTGTYTITASSGLNVRSGPGTGYGKVTAIPKGKTVSVTQTSGSWGQVTYNGRTGWISLDYAQKTESAPVQVEEGFYVLQSALGRNMVADIANGSASNCANLQLYSSNGTNAQIFKVTRSGSYYIITCSGSGKAIDVSNGSRASGTNVWQYDYNGSDAQKWQFVNAGNGYYYIRSALGTYLDVSGGNSSNGTNIWAYGGNGTASQMWKLVKVSAGSSASATASYREWDQQDSPWGSRYINPNNKSNLRTMSSRGCLVTSVAILIAKSGLRSPGSFDPGTLLTALQNNSGFSGNDLYWGRVSRAVPGFTYKGYVALSGSAQNRVNTIRDYYNQGYSIVVSVKSGGHYVAVDSAGSSSVTIIDPNGNQSSTSLFSAYGYSGVNRIYLYKAG